MSSTQPGHIDNLSEEQYSILQKLWLQLLKSLIHDKNLENLQLPTKKLEKQSSSISIFKSLSWSSKSLDVKEDITDSKEEMVKNLEFNFAFEILFLYLFGPDSPDATLLRFLRARKWDIEKTLDMINKALIWRKNFDFKTLLYKGEEILEKGELESGKGYLYGQDKEKRKCCFIHVRHHVTGKVPQEELEKFSVFIVENGRLFLNKSVETFTLVFDMNGFSMQCMDYNYVKFLLSCFEAYYPESLGQILVIDSPWIFNGCWTIIKGWIDPVVASKIKFISSSELKDYVDVQFIPKLILESANINYPNSFTEEEVKKGYEFQYFGPTEKDLVELSKKRNETEKEKMIWKEFKKAALEFMELTNEWSVYESKQDSKLSKDRLEQYKKLNECYQNLVPFIK
ncbi:hypothetical protein HK099_005815 [Clydaea vesicula]|uniref:CRAL-TRIO domain-containing protein n=1 Tax=Clydaea vesicula TaxID=447962 RepID=A0AAD5XUN8_9FUNG|nr:hypothetical protein HK099_005815 [Clydaea vesicula]